MKRLVATCFILLQVFVYGKTGDSNPNDDYFSIGAHLSADGLSRALRGTLNDLLHSNHAQKQIESLWFEKISVEPKALLDRFAKDIDAELANIKQQIERITKNATFDERNSENPCSQSSPLKSDFCCSTVENAGNWLVDRNLTNEILKQPAIDSFFLLNRKQFTECPPKRIPSKRRTAWPAAALGQRSSPNSKNDIVIAIDLAGVTSEVQVARVKAMTKLLMEVALEGDRYSMLVNTVTGFETQCSRSIKTLQDYVDQLKLPDAQLKSQHPKILDEATRLWKNEPNTNHILHYISRGMLSELSEAPKTLEVLANRYFDLPFRFRVNTFAIGDETGTPLLWSAEFLESIAQLDFGRYKQSMSSKIQSKLSASTTIPITGRIIALDDSELQNFHLTTALELNKVEKSDYYEQNERFYVKTNDKMTVLTSTQDLLVGFEVDLSILVDSLRNDDIVVHSPVSSRLNAYLLDLNGQVLGSSGSNLGKALFHLADLDSWKDDDRHNDQFFKMPQKTGGEFLVITSSGENRKYQWRRLTNGPFLVAIGYTNGKLADNIRVQHREERQMANFDHLVYYQFDLQRDHYVQCAYHGSLSVLDKASLFLSADAFEPAARKLEINEQLVVNYWVYLTDRIGLIRSSIMKKGVREEAAILATISKLWTGIERTPSVIRRFAATRRGLMVVQPAAVIEPTFEPRQQKWFTAAIESPGKVAISGPVADAVLGDVVTLSTTISIDNQELCVIGVEVPMYYLTHIIERSVSSCTEGRRCLLLSSIGNTVSLPAELIRTISVDAVERYHVAHVDPMLSSHLLSAKTLFWKSECQDPRGPINHQFTFNLSFSRVQSNGCSATFSLAHRQPLHSEVLLVPQTNVFLVLINETCSRERESGHFCPCSVSDRRCLFCARFDAMECECPCQCQKTHGHSCQKEEPKTHRVPLCGPSASNSFEFARAPSFLEECQSRKCESIQKPLPCELSAGCTWCQGGGRKTQGCAQVTECYRGSPGRSVIAPARGEEAPTPGAAHQLPGTPLSLIGGLACCLFIGLLIVIYSCYRTRVSRLRERRICSTDPSGVPLCSRFGSMDPNEDFHFDHEGLSHEKLVVLASFERTGGQQEDRPAPRGPPTVSDLGYSTMTEKTGGEDSDAGNGRANPLVRLRLNETTVILQNHPQNSSHLDASLRKSTLGFYKGFSTDHPLSIPSSSSSVVTTEADIHQPPANLLPQLIE